MSSSPTRLQSPVRLQDMLLYRMNRLRAVGGGMVLRYCEGQFGITRREWVMLALLSSSGGPVQPSELAVRAELNNSATSKAITAMVEKGLVSRHSMRGNRRVAQLELTEEGKRLYEAILPLVDDINKQLMAQLKPDEIAMLDSMMERMQAQADVMSHTLAEMPRADRRRGGSRRQTKSDRSQLHQP